MAAVPPPGRVGLDWDTIRSGLASFVNDADNAPGRFNVLDYRGATVIADYGHNPDAMRALVAAVDAMPAQAPLGRHQRRRRPARRATSASRPRSWATPSTTSSCTRTPASAAAPTAKCMALLRAGLAAAPSARSYIEEIRGEFIAIDTALARLQPGDLCLILVDQVEEALAHLAQRVAEAGQAAPAGINAETPARPTEPA